jgi:hypothetical protein
MHEHRISGEAIERLDVWLRVHSPHLLVDADIVRGLVVIVEEEVKRAIAEHCWKRLRLLGVCPQ